MNGQNKNGVLYIDSMENGANNLVFNALKHFENIIDLKKTIVIANLGTDKSTGDSYGPFVGSRLKEDMQNKFNNIHIYGCIDHPIHALNIKNFSDFLEKKYKGSLVIAVDACLGFEDHIGFLTLAKGAIKPGAALEKELPCIGDLSISGIVNYYSKENSNRANLANTSLSKVMKMADATAEGIISFFDYIHKKEMESKLNKEFYFAQ